MANEAVKRITEEEYFAILEASPVKLDFIAGRIIDPWAMDEGSPEAMAGGRIRHSLIAANLNRALGPIADAKDCLVLTSDVQVRVNEEGDYCFPDLTLVCGEVSQSEVMLDEPTVVVEVLSPGTKNYDRGEKFEGYLRLPSIQEIVFAHQERPLIERYRRHGEVWVYERAEGMEAQIDVLGLPLRLADAYRRVEFPPANP